MSESDKIADPEPPSGGCARAESLKSQDTAIVDVEVQWQTQRDSTCPQDEEIRQWARLAIESEGTRSADSAQVGGELAVRIVGCDEMQSANHQWRNIDKSTNVLSFPSDLPTEIGFTHYGDMLICAEVLAAESVEQGKSAAAHWAHIVIHGTLHLLGYDHIDAADAAVMERREIEILATLGIGNPYLTAGDTEIPVSEVSKS